MTHPIQLTNLKDWWEELSFPEKEMYGITEKDELVLKPLPGQNERVIATLSPETASITFKSLVEKFADTAAKVADLQNDWDNTPDKLKLSTRVEKLRETLQHLNAIGNIEGLMLQVQDWYSTIKALSQENLNAKLKLVEEAEGLVLSDNWKDTSKIFRDMTEQWKSIGYVPKNKNEALWNRLEEARNKFYSRKRNNQEEIEKETLQNIDKKMELVEKAEALTDSTKWKETSEIFRQLMESWKAIGRTSADKSESLWNRFIAAKNNFYDRKKEHFEQIQKEQEANYEAKKLIVEKAEALKDDTNFAPTTHEFAELAEQWKTFGRTPAETGDDLWGRFNAARDTFFHAKRQHMDAKRQELEENYTKKLALHARAQSLKNSPNWRDATEEMNTLMDEWKKIGSIPREYGDTIWEEFIAARRHFFKRKDENREQRKKQIEQNTIDRVENSRNFLKKIQQEIKEEEEALADFRNGLENITPGRKEQELRAHLQQLITDGEASLVLRHQKLAELTKVVGNLEEKTNEQGVE